MLGKHKLKHQHNEERTAWLFVLRRPSTDRADAKPLDQGPWNPVEADVSRTHADQSATCISRPSSENSCSGEVAKYCVATVSNVDVRNLHRAIDPSEISSIHIQDLSTILLPSLFLPCLKIVIQG